MLSLCGGCSTLSYYLIGGSDTFQKFKGLLTLSYKVGDVIEADSVNVAIGEDQNLTLTIINAEANDETREIRKKLCVKALKVIDENYSAAKNLKSVVFEFNSKSEILSVKVTSLVDKVTFKRNARGDWK